MKVVGIIPCRMGSTRLPGKPLLDICGKPMVQWVWEAAVRAEELNQVVVTAPDKEIGKATERFGAEFVQTSYKCDNGTERLAEAAYELNLKSDTVLINIQGDEPLIHTYTIDSLARAAKYLKAYADKEVMTVCYPSTSAREFEDLSVAKTVLVGEKAIYFSRSSIPTGSAGRFYKHIGLYAYTFHDLLLFIGWAPKELELIERLEQLRWLEHGWAVSVVRATHDSISVDTPSDLELVRSIVHAR